MIQRSRSASRPASVLSLDVRAPGRCWTTRCSGCWGDVGRKVTRGIVRSVVRHRVEKQRCGLHRSEPRFWSRSSNSNVFLVPEVFFWSPKSFSGPRSVEPGRLKVSLAENLPSGVVEPRGAMTQNTAYSRREDAHLYKLVDIRAPRRRVRRCDRERATRRRTSPRIARKNHRFCQNAYTRI